MIRATIIIMILSAFASAAFSQNKLNAKDFVGIYGDCNQAQSGIYLNLNEDQTFEFYNASYADDPIQQSGVWEMGKKYIVLHTGDEDVNWYPDKSCLKNRKGALHLRLCPCDE